jgi:SAM-dependent methyltransferase
LREGKVRRAQSIDSAVSEVAPQQSRNEPSEISRLLDAWLPDRDRLEVLDAGCGSRLPVAIGKPARITGIDISPESMRRASHLDRYIEGDIQTYVFDAAYDLVVCMNVLEHVPYPKRAIANLAGALRPGGLIVLGFPNPLSLKGLATKFTPHWFHVMVLRRVFGYSKAGLPGHAPFPTYLRFSLAAPSVAGELDRIGLYVLLQRTFEGNQPRELRHKSMALYSLYRSLCAIANATTLGVAGAERSESLIIACRHPPHRG